MIQQHIGERKDLSKIYDGEKISILMKYMKLRPLLYNTRRVRCVYSNVYKTSVADGTCLSENGYMLGFCDIYKYNIKALCKLGYTGLGV